MKVKTTQEYIAAEYGSLVGKRIVQVRPLTDEELSDYYWHDCGGVGMVIIFDDGSALVPSADEEGNGPGHLFLGTVA